MLTDGADGSAETLPLELELTDISPDLDGRSPTSTAPFFAHHSYDKSDETRDLEADPGCGPRRMCCGRDACSRRTKRTRTNCCLQGCCFWGCCSPICAGLGGVLGLIVFLLLIFIGGMLEKDVFDALPDTDSLYENNLVCGSNGTTLPGRAAAIGAGLDVVNCGHCGDCSNRHDIDVYNNTRNTLTGLATNCAMFSFIGAKQVSSCYEGRIGFTPACETCWVDNVMCDFRHCKWTCLGMFLSGQKRNREHDNRINDCLLCDERVCGPAFLACAGANRRSSGLVSDIGRKSVQNCNQTTSFD